MTSRVWPQMCTEDIRLWRRALSRHPGVMPATVFTGMGTVAGAERGLAGAIAGGAVLSVFWIPVLWTAWTMRRN
jgi:hypothetical protein